MIHERNNLQPDDRHRLERSDRSQRAKILAYFKNYPTERFTPFDIAARLFTVETPVTSIRRALTDLTNDGLLEKHEEDQVRERFGVSNCRWSLASTKGQLSIF